MKGWIKIIVFLIIPVTAFLLILSGIFNEKVEPGIKLVEAEQVDGIEIGEVNSETYNTGNKVFGSIVSDENAKIASEIMANVSNVLVKNGDFVKQGQTLVLLDNEKVNASLNQVSANIDTVKAKVKSIDETIKQVEAAVTKAQADLILKEKMYSRMTSLYEAGAVSLQEKDEAETAYLAAKAQLAEVEARLATTNANRTEVLANLGVAEAAYNSASISVQDATITAPFAGVVVETIVDTGDMVNPGMPLLTVEKAPYYLEVFVDERKQSEIKIGDQISVTIDALQNTVQGKVTEITPKIDPASRTFRVKIEVPQTASKLKSGMFGYAIFPEGDQKGIFIPKTAIYYWSQLTAVFVVDDQGIAHLRYVQLGKEQDQTVEVLSGLNPGERIVLSNIEKVKDGVRVVAAE
ncbi:RND family efflux transporter, MFP subunit [Schinkia azotoformans MEV2011]|uniref:RND family efflux transporter, MFP subunit n=1 Tax=Schinkia azotoformans MEV2011 TaxID=1348973 RepID=A0A072NYA8_SCHAZ|nr:efflux RND transporter periplasmic adaptor subunit [Schinkia azotoformans]KEF38225.1 RND family efflux transporter, MFP subunit [Schinkia azotoformans MEV2011]MEC1697396.1 efflux RND transporter periplasmic adaptor subunit [Schinkia azotoformans]MEC1714285.1 efflux RND transporter periplasmic adaptor subunit [Schinkia azotoformans]MEC1723415.1 efflux RND transporter periplasmic adaptor subunit [Schinkia azotoformans]MEC1741300.1 efflux RND transporter periplasmic adaptor subunit [Schinkia a